MRFPYASWNDFSKSKILETSQLQRRLEDIRSASQQDLSGERRTSPVIATLNGSFDLLHAGHMHILYEASRISDILVVALNTDSSIKRYKSPSRPIIPLQERMEMVSAMAFVDYVTWFDEDDPRELLETLRPDIHVNGAEYGSQCIEADTVRKIGARLHLVQRIPGLATSSIIRKIRNLPEEKA